MSSKYTLNPYQVGKLPIERTTSKFRFGLLPATPLFFLAFISITYGLAVLENVIRDAVNGYDMLYLILSACFPFALFGMGACCTLAGRMFVVGQWRAGLKFIGVLLGFASIVGWYVWLLT